MGRGGGRITSTCENGRMPQTGISHTIPSSSSSKSGVRGGAWPLRFGSDVRLDEHPLTAVVSDRPSGPGYGQTRGNRPFMEQGPFRPREPEAHQVRKWEGLFG